MSTPAMPEGLHSLPVYLQAGSVVAAAIIGGAIAFFGYTKKWLDKLPQPQKVSSSDAVVVSGAFADTKPLNDLVAETKKLRASVEELLDCTRQSNTIHRAQTDSIDGLTEQVRRLVRVEMEKE